MAAQYTVPDPSTPGKMFMNYQGLASYLSSGGELSELHVLIHSFFSFSHSLPHLTVVKTNISLLF